MQIRDIKPELKSKTITVEGFANKKEENKDGHKALLFSIRDGELVLYSRVKDDNTKLYNIAKKIQNGDKIEITGELKTIKGVDEDKITFLSPDEMVKVQEISKQLYRADARNAFVEFMGDAFEIGKLKINFIDYNANNAVGSRINNTISCYMDINEARTFCRRILSGYYNRRIAAEKEAKKNNPSYYYKPVFQSLGGVNAETLAIRNQRRTDGKSLSRSITIEVSTADKYAFTLIGSSGAGNVSQTGLIVPDGKPEKVIRIPMTEETATELALCLKDHISGYIAAQYLKSALRNI